MTAPFSKLAERLSSLGLSADGIEAALAPARAALVSPPRILIMGGFNVGKSSVVNALVGAPVAPVGAIPVTALLTQVSYGPEHRVRCKLRSGETAPLDPEAFRRLVDQSARDAAAAEQRAQIRHIEVEYPTEILRRATLVDSPGLGSLDARDDATTEAAISEADAVFWVFDAVKGAPEHGEVETLKRLGPKMRRAWGVLNKADLCTPTEKLRVQEAFDKQIGRYFRRLKLYSADLAIKVASERVEADDAAGVRLDLVDLAVESLHDMPRSAHSDVREKALGLARDAACLLAGRRWRALVADCEAAERFGGIGVEFGRQALDDYLSAASSEPWYERAEEKFLRAVSEQLLDIESLASPPPGFASPRVVRPLSEADRARVLKLLKDRCEGGAHHRANTLQHLRKVLEATLTPRVMHPDSHLVEPLARAGLEFQTWSDLD